MTTIQTTGAATVTTDDGSTAIVNEGAAPAAGVNSRIDPGTRSTIKVVAIAFGIAFLVTLALFFLTRQRSAQLDASALPTPLAAERIDVALTPYERNRLDEQQRLDAEAARERGASYVPGPLGMTSERRPAQGEARIGPNPDAVFAKSTPTPPSQPEVREYVPTADQQARAAARIEGMNRLLGLLVAEDNAGAPITRVAIVTPQVQQAQQASPQHDPAAQGLTAGQGASIVPPPLTIQMARLVSPVDTAKTSYVSAEITSGQYAGAFLIGNATLVNGEGLRIVLTSMRLRNQTASVNAIALDEATSADAMDASIDRHLLARYVLPVITAGVSGAASALARPAAAILGLGQVATVVQERSTNREAAAAAVGAGVQGGQQIVQQLGQQPNSASVPVNTRIGILFLESGANGSAHQGIGQPQIQPFQQPLPGQFTGGVGQAPVRLIGPGSGAFPQTNPFVVP